MANQELDIGQPLGVSTDHIIGLASRVSENRRMAALDIRGDLSYEDIHNIERRLDDHIKML
ncbi:MAG: hypothetical protein JWO96_779, partial [Candidatus Saccharibacteria bacterium]|nr:hypothetical protein [Candidatus Saccharibacteria bacterium]